MSRITSLSATITTAAGKHAGTNDRVWLDVGGHTFELTAAAHDLFERDHTDEFVLPLPAPGVPAEDIWRVIVCKAPDHDADGWQLDGVILRDQSGKILYSRGGIDARLDEATGRQWQAPDFAGAPPPPSFTLPADALRVLLEGPLQDQLHGDFHQLSHVRPVGGLALTSECDGIHLKQTIRGRIALTDVDVQIAGRLQPFISAGDSGHAVELTVGGIQIDIKIPAWIHVLSGGVTAAIEKHLEQILRRVVQREAQRAINAQVGALKIDLTQVDRIALRPGAIDVIEVRPPAPRFERVARPFPLRWQ
ncbi:MAG: hypothetical protein K8W52_12140 [Deltaproteobacteria bacterium]|nr:hypothetical protein [Deltaproteobacteria bacterium]